MAPGMLMPNSVSVGSAARRPLMAIRAILNWVPRSQWQVRTLVFGTRGVNAPNGGSSVSGARNVPLETSVRQVDGPALAAYVVLVSSWYISLMLSGG